MVSLKACFKLFWFRSRAESPLVQYSRTMVISLVNNYEVLTYWPFFAFCLVSGRVNVHK